MLKVRQVFDKYKIERRLGEGGFAIVYQALDTIEGVRVALKIPHGAMMDETALKSFRHEARLTAKLDHPNILPLKYACFIDGQFVIVTPMGEKTLADRLRSRMSFQTIMDYAEQTLEAVAYAHRRRIMHCDIKPENIILFPGNRLRLTDFGTAKVAIQTIRSSGTGTIGYMAPEQAMGQPSLRSDVFSLGLLIYRMLTGQWPEWPYDWPPPGHLRLKRRPQSDFVNFLRKAIDLRPRKRFSDADQMLASFRRIKTRALNFQARKKRK